MTLIGTTLDHRYEVVQLVGEGGMGVVYQGRHLALGRKVAIKVLLGELCGEKHVTERFMQEAQIAGSLGHPNICEVTDVGATPEGVPYMVMPFLEGQTLGDALLGAEDRAEGFPMARSVDIVSQVLSALQPAHEAGIVHRDLKPENIFLTQAGDRRDFVKVLDFGISKIVAQDQPNLRRLTSTGMVVGTPYYMAPEQASGARDLDPRVDIYAVGALLFELLTGRPPFEGESYNEIIIKIVGDSLVSPRELNPEIPEPLAAVTMRALAKKREDRFANVQAFQKALLGAAEAQLGDLAVHRAKDEPGAVEPPSNTLSSAAAEIRDTVPTVSVRGTVEVRRQSSWGWAVGGGAALVAAVVVILAMAVRYGGDDSATRPSKGRAGVVTSPAGYSAPEAGTTDARPPSAPEVTIEFQGLPPGGRVTLGGKKLTGSQVTVPRSQWKLGFRAEAPDHLPAQGSVMPDRDRVVQLHLAPMARPRDGDNSRDPGAPDAAAPGARPPGAMPPGMAWSVIMGRQGSSVKTDYDADD